MVEPQPLPLQRVLGDEVGAGLRRPAPRATASTVPLRRVRARAPRTDGRVTAVVLADGTELPADVVVVGVGIRPNVELAAAAGLDVDNGIVVDASLRTADPDVFAAGDVAAVATRCSAGRSGSSTGRTR